MESSIAVFLMRHLACELMPIECLHPRNKKKQPRPSCRSIEHDPPFSLGGVESFESKGNLGCEPVRLPIVLAQDHFYSDY